ncbi:tyrosine-type recombinase/integrase [Solirubrobacter pauli]|uniref:tyrosine-type recombinase/integrase n=1 Tax=Solirubrobacter pauli TaxID=166793 RepID=UPI00147770C3|nr:tyrosine-type recombinase/integrase [Solirubrobacter pauli]
MRWKEPGTGRRPVEEFDSVDDALDFLAHLRLAKRRGVLADLTRGDTSLAEFFETEYWPKDAKRNLALNTRKSYLSVWYVHLKPRLGHLQMRQLNPPTVQIFREQMEEDGVGTSTTKRAMAILQAVCRYALSKGEIVSNPVKDVRKPTVRRALAVHAIAPAQVETLRTLLLDGYVELRPQADGTAKQVRHAPDPVAAMLVSLLAYEGLRPEEALALEDRHAGKATLLIEQKNIDGQIEAGQKTGKPPRSPALWAPVRTDLASYRLATRRRTARDGRQFLIQRADGEPWREYDYRNWRKRVFKPAVAAAGLPITRPYDLRHACASLMIHAGKPLTEIAEHLGNSVAVLSQTYSHVIKDMRDEPSAPVSETIVSARAASRLISA